MLIFSALPLHSLENLPCPILVGFCLQGTWYGFQSTWVPELSTIQAFEKERGENQSTIEQHFSKCASKRPGAPQGIFRGSTSIPCYLHQSSGAPHMCQRGSPRFCLGLWRPKGMNTAAVEETSTSFLPHCSSWRHHITKFAGIVSF